MLGALVRESLLYTVASVIHRGLFILLLPLYTNHLSLLHFGMVEILLIWEAVMRIAVPLEVNQGLGRALPDLRDDVAAKRRHAATAFWFTLLMFAAFAGLVWALQGPLAHGLLDGEESLAALRWSVPMIGATLLFEFSQGLLRWERRPGAFLLGALCYALLLVALSVWLVVLRDHGVLGFVWAQGAASLGGALAGIGVLRRLLGPVFDARLLRRMLAYSAPLVPSSLCVFLSLSLDRLVIKAHLSLEEVAMYGAGFRIASAVGLLLVGLQVALPPFVLSHHREERLPRELARIFRLVLAGVLGVVAAMSLLAEELVLLMSTAAFAPVAAALPLLALALVLSRLYVFAVGPNIARRTGIFLVVNVVVLALNLGLNLLLVPRLGIHGAALATLVSSAAMFGLLIIASQRLYPVPYPWWRLGLILLLVAGACALAQLMGLALALRLGLLALLLLAAAALAVERGDRDTLRALLRRGR